MDKITREIIQADFEKYDIGHSFLSRFTFSEKTILFRYMRNLRLLEETKRKMGRARFLYLIPFCFRFLKHRRLSVKYDIWIAPFSVGRGFHMTHLGYRRIDSFVKIGENCTVLPGVLFGKKKPGIEHSVINVGNNCYIGAGATILGPCTIGNNVTIAAGAVVCTDFPEDNIVIGGVPAVILKRGTN